MLDDEDSTGWTFTEEPTETTALEMSSEPAGGFIVEVRIGAPGEHSIAIDNFRTHFQCFRVTTVVEGELDEASLGERVCEAFKKRDGELRSKGITRQRGYNSY